MTDDPYSAMFRELCVELGFCSLDEERVLAQLPMGTQQAARAVFAAEGLDFDTYERDSVKVAVVNCIARHLEAPA